MPIPASAPGDRPLVEAVMFAPVPEGEEELLDCVAGIPVSEAWEEVVFDPVVEEEDDFVLEDVVEDFVDDVEDDTAFWTMLHRTVED
jgi:hypothetical protein